MKQFYTFLAAVLLTATSVAQVGINNDNPDPSAALDIVSTTGGLLVPRMKETERDEITSPSQGLIIFCTDCASGEGELQVKLTSSWISLHDGGDVNDPPPAPLAIGDLHQGGIVFYLDGNGGGLIAAPSDQSPAVWGCYGEPIGGTGSAIGTGNQNTMNIVEGCDSSESAAYICANLILGGYEDWFLPSEDELYKMYLKREDINTTALANNGSSFSPSFYWSSTESDDYHASRHYFINEGWQSVVTKNGTLSVRAVRAF